MISVHTHSQHPNGIIEHLAPRMREKRQSFRLARRQRWINRTADRLGLSPHLLSVCMAYSLPVRKAYLSQN